MKLLPLAFPGLLCLLSVSLVTGLENWPPAGLSGDDIVYVVPIEVESVSDAPVGITFRIHNTAYALDVYRKLPHETSWGNKITTISAGTETWTHNATGGPHAITVGTAYEYRFHAQGVPSAWDSAHVRTHVMAGINVDRSGPRGRVVLVMPESIQEPLAPEIARFKQDLVGDGWTVHDVLTPDGRDNWTCAQDGHHVGIRNEIIGIYNAHPGEVKHVILLGRVPQPRSGQRVYYRPDGHGDLGAVAADMYYADVDNTWTDSLTLSSPGTVNNAWQNVPGDGRFDQSHFRHLTEAFEMGWGRIDFRGSVNGGDEIGALRNYLDKLHDYKHAQNGFVPGRRSIVRDAGSLYKHVQEEFWKTITPLSGMENLEYITGNDLPNSAGQPEAQYTYDNGPYLYFFMAGNEPNQPSDNSRAVFWTGFKSHMGYHDLTSWTRSRLAEPNGWTLSWTFAPPRGRYVYHRMALGGTIGDMMKATINNQNSSSGLYGSAVKNYINGAWTVQSPSGATNDYAGYTFHNHMGDPTLRDQMIASPSWVRGRLLNGGSQVHVEWQASPDATHGYDVYSAPDVLGPFTKRNGSPLHVNATSGELSWTDTAPPSDPVVYMVRALKMEDTPSGSYLNASVGRMVEVDRSPAPFAIVTAELPNAYLGSSYDVQLETSGGNPPAIWTVTSGTLPSGLSLSSSGRITGTPANAGAFTLTLQAEDLLGATQSRSFTLDVDMFSTWTLLPNGDFAAPPHNTGSVNQWFSGNWQHPATPNSQWDYDAENQWAVTYRDGRTGAQPGLVYVYQDDFAQTGAVSFRHDLINTDGSGKPNTMYVRIYGINGDFSWDHWNLGSNPSGDATLLHISEITGSFDWTTFETPALPVGDGYEFYVLRFYPTDVTTAEGDFMAIDNLYMSAAAPPPVFYDVTFSAGTNGSLEGTLSQTLVGGGSTEAVTAVPDPGYELSQWTWTGGGTSTDNPLVIANVSDDLAVTAHFQLFNNPPVSAITSPEDGASFPVNTAISFNGTGSDPEDGEITDAVWESSIDGVFEPVGGSYSGLSHGEHSIIRTVTDSGGKTGSDSITLTILEPLVRVAVADAMVRGDGGNADTNYGSATTIRTRSSESAEGLYRFDVDNVPGTLLSATLRLNLSANDTGAINVMEVADNSWGEMTVTYNTRPDYGEIIGQMSGEGVGQNNFMELDVTNYVLSRLPDGQASFATTGTGMLVRVNSREVAAAERHPQLVIVYTLEDINLEPLVEITSPANETVVFAGDEVIFEGTALDPEDGDLTAAAVWTSSLDGPLGSGGALSLDTLSVGEHLITLSATDSGNATGSDQIVLTVLEPATTETVILVAEADTDVRGDNPDTNYGESTVLRTRGSQQHESLYRFDLSGVSGTIVSATLQLTLSANDTGTLDIHGIADNSWEEMTVTFNTKPAYGDVIAQMVTGGVSGTQHEADVTAYVAAQLAEGKVSFATTSANFVRMQSREVSTEANRPQLTVVYSVGETSNTPPTVAITAPADNTTVTEGDSVTFTGTATDAEDGDITANATWTSSLDGALGSGGSVSTTTLSPGIHTVTFEVTDSGGLSDMEQISLTVEAAPSVPAVPPGYVSVLDFGADPSGQTDSTAALQDAINHGIAHQVAVWFPAGEYRISERLIADQPDDDPDYPAVLIGSTADPSQRAVIVLAANSPGFNNPDARRVMLHFFNRGTADNESGENTLYNQAVIGIDFRVESGNDGAVALRMQGAEGCTIQDVHIDLTQGGHTGIWGVPGSGGTTHQVTVTGGVIGVDTRKQNLSGGGSQPTVTITGSGFVGQSDVGVWASTRGAMVLVGAHFERDTPGPVLRLQRHHAEQPFDGTLQMVDCTVVHSVHHPDNTVIDMPAGEGRSFYLENVFVQNGERIWTEDAPANPSGWMRFVRLAAEVRPGSQSWGQPMEVVWINGLTREGILLESEADAAPPADLQSRHQWASEFPTWETSGAVNALDHGAAGDGVTDDHAALQALIDAHDIVFLPKGHYRVSNTLHLRPESKLIGVHHNYSVIEALSTLDDRFAGTTEEAGDRPIVSTADDANAETVLAFLHLKRHYPLAQHNPTPVGNYALEWRSGGDSVLRGVRLESRSTENIRPDFVASQFYGLGGGVNANYPQDDFPEGMWAWPGSEPTVQVRGNGGGRWFGFWVHGRQALRSHVPFLRVEGTRQPLHFYHLHLQQQDSVNHAEFLDVENVSVYGTKSELKGTLLYFEDSRHFRVFGSGGLASPDPNRPKPYLFRFVDCDDFQISGFAETVNAGNSEWIGGPFDRWIHANVLGWNSVQDAHAGRLDVVVPSTYRPVLYLRTPEIEPPPGPVGAIFAQDFSGSSQVGDYIGSDDHLFDFIGVANSDNRATLSITGGRLRNTIAYSNDENESQFSAARATRRTDLPVEENFAVVQAVVRLAPDNWPESDTTYFGLNVGQNFRAGIFNPAGGSGNGPAFGTLNLQARGSNPGAFRTTGSGGNSGNFTVLADGGVYAVDVVFAANGGTVPRTFPSPTGSHTLQPGRVSVWINGALHIDNTGENVSAAEIVNVSFSTGSGTAQGYETGSVFNGYYEIGEVTIRTVSNFTEGSSDPYETWALENDIGGSPTDLTDGVPNLLRYALGGDAETPASAFLLVPTLSGSGMSLFFPRVEDDTLTYEIWATDDLNDWGEEPEWEGQWNTPFPEEIPPVNGRLFLHLRVRRE